MPEGPECRKIALQISQELTNKNICHVTILSGRYSRHDGPTGLSDFKKQMPITALGSGVHGKFIYILLQSEWTIWCTLGMTGSWSKQPTQHSRVSFQFDDGMHLYFNDIRNFGTLKFVKGKEKIIEKLNDLGPDMLAEDVSDEKFLRVILNKPKKTVAQALMDQSIIAGVGNYIKAEALYLSKISPHRLCEDLSADELSNLNYAIKAVIRESYDSGGATLQAYKDLNGEAGKFSERFCVYGRATDPMGRDVIKESTKDGRETHWVPAVQR